jgi:hypothetical protein
VPQRVARHLGSLDVGSTQVAVDDAHTAAAQPAATSESLSATSALHRARRVR